MAREHEHLQGFGPFQQTRQLHEDVALVLDRSSLRPCDVTQTSRIVPTMTSFLALHALRSAPCRAEEIASLSKPRNETRTETRLMTASLRERALAISSGESLQMGTDDERAYTTYGESVLKTTSIPAESSSFPTTALAPQTANSTHIGGHRGF